MEKSSTSCKSCQLHSVPLPQATTVTCSNKQHLCKAELPHMLRAVYRRSQQPLCNCPPPSQLAARHSQPAYSHGRVCTCVLRQDSAWQKICSSMLTFAGGGIFCSVLLPVITVHYVNLGVLQHK